MSFTYSTVLTEDLSQANRLNKNNIVTKGYETVGSGGTEISVVVVHKSIVDGRVEPIESARSNMFAPGVVLADFSGLAYVTLTTDKVTNGITRVTRAAQVGALGVIFHAYTQIEIGDRPFVLAEQVAYWIPLATISGTDILGGGLPVPTPPPTPTTPYPIFVVSRSDFDPNNLIDTDHAGAGSGELIQTSLVSGVSTGIETVLVKFSIVGTFVLSFSGLSAYLELVVDGTETGFVYQWNSVDGGKFSITDIVPVNLLAGSHSFQLRASSTPANPEYWVLNSGNLSVIQVKQAP